MDNYERSERFIIPKSGFEGVVFETMHHSKTDIDGLTLAEYSKQKGVDCIAITWNHLEILMKRYNHKRYLKAPAARITKEQYWDMLEVLPPENWCKGAAFEHFRMMEYYTGTITTQYATNGRDYIAKNIDVCDKSTWITSADFETAQEG